MALPVPEQVFESQVNDIFYSKSPCSEKGPWPGFRLFACEYCLFALLVLKELPGDLSKCRTPERDATLRGKGSCWNSDVTWHKRGELVEPRLSLHALPLVCVLSGAFFLTS